MLGVPGFAAHRAPRRDEPIPHRRSHGHAAGTALPPADPRSLPEYAHALLASLQDGLVVRALDGSIVDVNPRFCELTGFSPSELVGHAPPFPYWPDEPHEPASTRARALRRDGGHEADATFRRKDGSPLPVILSVAPLRARSGRVEGYVQTVKDATERRRLADEAAQDRALWREVVERAPVGVAIWDRELRYARINPVLAAINGLPPEAHIGRRVDEVLPALDGATHDVLATVLTTQEPLVGLEVSGTTPAEPGRRRHWLASYYPLHDGDGEVVGVGGIVIEVTELRDAESGLRSSEERHRSIIETAVDGIVTMDSAGRIESFNPAAERLFGYSAAEAIGASVTMLMPEPYRSEHAGYVERYEATGERRIIGRGREVTGLRRDASEFPLHLSVGEMEVDGRKLYTGIVRDVTEQRRNEEALRASEARLRESELAARRIAAEQTALRRVASAIAAQASQETVHDRVAQEAARVLGGEMGMVARFEGQNMVVVGSYQQPPEVHVGAVLPLGDGTAVARVARFGRPAHIDDYDRLDASEPIVAAMLGRGVRSAAAAPVLVEGELWGAVAAATTSEAGLPGDAVARLMRFAELVGAAISNAQTRSLLAARATTDQLTNLPNQATFHEKLDGEVERARRYGRPLSLVVFDIDHFKSINDTYGHQAGDRALAAVATRLRELVRSEDTLARVGGEEFAWVMPETASMGAWQAADRARQIVASEPVDGVGTLTISAGVCDVERARSAGELFRLADVALYWAKAQGRNGVVRYSPEVVEVTSASDRDARIARHEKLGSVRMLARAIDARDPSTHAHSERVADLAARLARASGWGSDRVALLREAALVHDVGKIGVPDAILFKADRLTSDEYGQVKAHAPLGAQMLLDALSDEQVGWIRHHHEAWNGCGYPDALREEEIPEGAQLLALADAWDAMTGVRLYRPPRTAEEALSECRAQRGRQFSPGSVDALERAWAAGELRSHRTAVERETGRNGHARRVAAVGERPAPAPRDRL